MYSWMKMSRHPPKAPKVTRLALGLRFPFSLRAAVVMSLWAWATARGVPLTYARALGRYVERG